MQQLLHTSMQQNLSQNVLMSVNKQESLLAYMSPGVISAILCFQIIDGVGLHLTSIIYLGSDYHLFANIANSLYTRPHRLKLYFF